MERDTQEKPPFLRAADFIHLVRTTRIQGDPIIGNVYRILDVAGLRGAHFVLFPLRVYVLFGIFSLSNIYEQPVYYHCAISHHRRRGAAMHGH
jgi:hypothetical protein